MDKLKRNAILKDAFDAKMENTGEFKTVNNFNTTWRALNNVGHCDCINGGEYERVLLSWLLDGKPSDIRTYIREEANNYSYAN